MEKSEYYDKVMGCWLGKNIGGTLGMPMEWQRRKNNVTYYTHDITGEPLPNDDLDIQILWLLALEERGMDIDAKILGEYFNEFMIFTHAEYGTAKTNLRSGLQPPVSGTYNNCFKDSCGAYIRADIWACLYPGHPEEAALHAFEDAIIDHGNGEGVYAEIFFAAVESAAFYETDIRTLIKIGLSYLPEECDTRKAIEKAVETYDAGMSVGETREYIMKNFIGHIEWHAISPEDEEKGYARGRMGWDVPSNLMIIIYGLLFGNGSYERAMCTAVNYGEDTDCTAGTIAALYGIMCGKDIFDEKWTKPIGNKIVTVSIDPFRMYGKIPQTLEELTDRISRLHELTLSNGIAETPSDNFSASPYFANIYDEMNTVRYKFKYLNVRLDYCGDPVIYAGQGKKIRLILSNTSKSITSDRVNVFLYSRETCDIQPQQEQSVFLTMAHMGDGIKSVEYEITVPRPARPVYRFVAELIFEENKNNMVMDVPFVLLSEAGSTLPVKWEKRGPASTPNVPRT